MRLPANQIEVNTLGLNAHEDVVAFLVACHQVCPREDIVQSEKQWLAIQIHMLRM